MKLTSRDLLYQLAVKSIREGAQNLLSRVFVQADFRAPGINRGSGKSLGKVKREP